ncbi:DUF1447 family protein [Oceanobacillus piezotolerans]|uniref:DNA-directed RNA polymerase subunit epsilon n=1 Tax=Oceanobacillus piezotolerans TaxID=2448030 RepID=A0A498DI53_9BACI|nr:DNA-directed RNA polymerase subunit epsilon [Oceanobacillus piezotolerans]RLL45185.1 DUF1447 family protein [Oceanobacillus piezotolerans]
MIYKVLYQELSDEVPIREHTQSMYIEAESVRQVRDILADRKANINIEFIQPLDETHLEYEKQSEHFKVENA